MAQDDVVVLLGGAGFVGQTLVEKLRGKVREIRIVSRKVDARDEFGLRYMRGDVADDARMMAVIEGATVVYQATVEQNYIQGATNVAEACVRHGVRRLIYTSTSDALDLSRPGTIYETDPTDPRPELRNGYSRGKGESEKLLQGYRQRHNLGVVIVRPALVMGRGGRLAHGGIGRWPTKTTLVTWGDGRNKLPFVLVEDVAQAMALALDAPNIEGKAFNLAGDVFLSAQEYAALVAEKSQRNVHCVPGNLFRYAAKCMIQGKLKGWLTHTKAEYPTYHEAKSAGMITFIDNSQSKKLLGWKPNASLEVFVREAIEPYVDPLHPEDLRITG